MGRFSKLETGVGEGPGDGPQDGPFGLRPRVRPRDNAATGDTPDYDQGYYLAQGDELFFSGEYQKAMRAYSRAMEVDQTAVAPWTGQVLSLIKMKQHREAAMWAMRGVEIFPESGDLVSLQGYTLALTGSHQRAIACSDFAMGLPGGGSPFAWLFRGQILAQADSPNATFCFDKVKELRPKNDWRLPALAGGFLLEKKKWALALEFLQMAVEAQPKNAFLWTQLALANEKLGLTNPAMQAYRAAMDLNPNNREAYYAMQQLTAVPLPVRLWRRLTGGRSG